jgi:hypothetical protein
MEIYSPRSKNKQLFAKNKLKVDTTIQKEPENLIDNKQYFIPSAVSQESIFNKIGKTFTEKLKVFFQYDEIV